MYTKEIEDRLQQILKMGDRQAVLACQEIVQSEDPELDEALFGFLPVDYLRPGVKRLASRLLAERDRDRDPGPLLAVFPEQTPKEEVKNIFQRFAYDLFDTPLVASFEYGYSRLRKLQPVAVYADLLSQDRKINVRLNVVLGLGDTGELEALDPLTEALADRNKAVRAVAADSVRRLRHAGAGEILPGHPIRESLVAALGDRHKSVRVAAARALVSLNDPEPVRNALRKSVRGRRELARVLRGEIPPLKKTWEGDDTT